MEAKDRVLFVQIVGQMLITDGVLADEERQYLDRLMESLGMEDDERRSAVAGISIDSPVEERIGMLGEDARRQLVDEVDKAMRASGKPSKSERLFLERIRAMLG